MNRLISVILVLAICLVGCNDRELNKDYLTDHSVKTEQENTNQSHNSQDNKINNNAEQIEVDTHSEDQNPIEKLINEEGSNVEERFLLPEGYKRIEIDEGSFEAYLRNLPLKPHGSKISCFDGRITDRKNVYEAVIDMDIGERDLQQCADAIMRLRGEYFYRKGEYDKIHFNFTNGFRVDYSKWMEGYRVLFDGNKTSLAKKKSPSNTYEDFRNYMELIFAFAGTISLNEELQPVVLSDMEIGDVLIQGGSPGHAVIIIDMAVHEESGYKIFMLAQSYMPAQDIHVLCNPNNISLSPWYQLEELMDMEQIRTPEWTFEKNNLKRFPEE